MDIDLSQGDIQPRTCGRCRACCTVFGVAELGKPYHRPCPHLTENGCGVYGDHPKSCKDFFCLWLDGGVPGDERQRPDKLGVIFGLCLYDEGTVVHLEIWEVRKGAMGTEQVQCLARQIVSRFPVISAVSWWAANLAVPVRYHIDAERWPLDVGFGNRHDPIRLDPQGGANLVYAGVPLPAGHGAAESTVDAGRESGGRNRAERAVKKKPAMNVNEMKRRRRKSLERRLRQRRRASGE